jgi:hypothetical protein
MISGETSELAEQNKLNAVLAVHILLLRRNQVSLRVFYEILDIYCYLLALPLHKLVLLH